ncbi:MAG: hypothetical protein COA69_11915 [Robiginitomaculum sp.]|nr:MAG: hypothetical protein COA69_11915 [Robiginitomaculum sp.]
MKKLLLTSLAVPAMMLGLSTAASAQEVEVSASVDYVSEYVFRGVTLAGDAIQPGLEASFGNFTFGGWLSVPIENGSNFDTELDLYIGYSFDLFENVSTDVGLTVYHYPESGGLFDFGTGGGAASTMEIYGALGFSGPLEPSLTAYYDLTLEAFTLEGSVGYSVPLAEKTSFDIGATVGAVSVKGAGDYQYGSLSGAVSYAVSEATSVYVGANFGFSSEDTFLKLSSFTPKGSSAWFGAGISTGF